MRFRQQRVVITGGSRGIGFATARAFLEEGAQVALVARSKKNLAAAERALTHTALRAYVCDLTDEKAIARLFLGLKKEFGGVDILINNAGVTLTGSLARHDDAALAQLLAVNLRAPLLCAREAFRLMKPKRRGLIVNISSNVAQAPLPYLAAYSSSKAALNALSFALRQETAPYGIQVGVIEPGAVATEMAKNLAPEFKRRFNRKIRALTPDGVARAITDFCHLSVHGNLKILTLEHQNDERL